MVRAVGRGVGAESAVGGGRDFDGVRPRRVRLAGIYRARRGRGRHQRARPRVARDDPDDGRRVRGSGGRHDDRAQPGRSSGPGGQPRDRRHNQARSISGTADRRRLLGIRGLEPGRWSDGGIFSGVRGRRRPLAGGVFGSFANSSSTVTGTAVRAFVAPLAGRGDPRRRPVTPGVAPAVVGWRDRAAVVARLPAVHFGARLAVRARAGLVAAGGPAAGPRPG